MQPRRASGSATPKSRAFAPKVQSGCFTCKKRRKKCDEEKPTCRRCRVGQFVCDGYSKPSTAAVKRREEVASDALVFLPPLANPSAGNSRELRFQHHFFTCTVYDIVDTADSTTFWTSAVVALHQQSPFIRNAIVALGAAHWAFLTGQDSPRHQVLVLDQYNRAIADLNRSMTTQRDLQAILTCCLLFVCLETLRGNQAVALQHLEAGSKLFLDHLRPGQLDAPLRSLAAALHSFINQASLFSESQLLPDLTPFFPSPADAAPADRPFLTLDEAHEALNGIDGVYNRFYWAEASKCDNYADGRCECARGCGCEGCRDWAALKDQVRQFSVCFAPLVDTQDELQDSRARRRLLRMRLAEKAWHRTMATEDTKDPAGSELYTADEAEEVFRLVEEVLAQASRPVFTLNTDVIPIIVEVYQRCTIASCRDRAIQLLRSHARQEVIFNSAKMADFLETDLARLGPMGEESLSTVEPSVETALVQYMPRPT